jgi:hypothetical protein
MYVPYIVNNIVQELIRSHITSRRPFHNLTTQDIRLLRVLSRLEQSIGMAEEAAI